MLLLAFDTRHKKYVVGCVMHRVCDDDYPLFEAIFVMYIHNHDIRQADHYHIASFAIRPGIRDYVIMGQLLFCVSGKGLIIPIGFTATLYNLNIFVRCNL